MTARIMNARMYAVTPEVEALWRALLSNVADDAGVALDYVSYPAPQPLEDLWARPDLGSVFMCGFPIASRLAPVVPLAAPIPRAAWATGRPYYRSDLIVRRNSPYRTFEDTFGGRAGWTVEHSHSGFNAFRHHLLPYRTAARPTLYSEMLGPLVTARRILDSVREGRIDVGPLDAYWHLLLAHHQPALTGDVRVLASTEAAPMPAFVAAADTPVDVIAKLRAAFVGAGRRPWFNELADGLLLDGFAEVSEHDFAVLLEWEREAVAADYHRPA
ncbi:MAG TPA: PhnD/SsuA/transferrin family substrate-binding protein [Steroidobacteraceae bacterium]